MIPVRKDHSKVKSGFDTVPKNQNSTKFWMDKVQNRKKGYSDIYNKSQVSKVSKTDK